MNEDELKSYLLKHFAQGFEVRVEVEGRFLVDDSKVVIDYLMRPKPDLVEKGFVPAWFGVEVKSPEGEGAKQGLRVAWQAITYSQSKFDGVRPAFVLIFPPLAEFFSTPGEVYYVVCLLQKANVGSIEIDGKKKKWKVKFGSNAYFYSDRGLSKTPNVGIKRHVGSWR